MNQEQQTFGTFLKSFFHNWKGKLWFLLNIFCTTIYLLWRIFFTIPLEYGIVSIVTGLFLLVVEVLGMVEAFIHYANMYSVAGYSLPENLPYDKFPDVDVFISTYNEEPELLYKTIQGCKRMKYPNRNKVHIYLCDDGHRPEMKALAHQMGVNYLDRENHDGAKAGNLNHALANTSSPYIVTLDADMIPRSDFLMKTMPYFVDAEIRNKGQKEEDQVKLGFLQSPQSFYDLDMFQFNLYSEQRIPNEQDYFYKDIQVARTKTNSVIYGGSNTVISREALEEIGGFYTGAITEDFATGILMEKKQYVSIGIGEPLASGLSPKNLRDLVQQRTRWARGVIATGRKMHIFTSSELNMAQKLNYWASIWYWYAPLKRLIYIMAPIMYATFGFMVFKCTLPQVLLFWLPMYITSNVSLRMLSRNIRTTKWTGIYETVMFPFMLLPVLLESVGISLKKFKVTQKGEQQNEKGRNFIYLIPFLILIILSVIGIIRCVLIMLDSGSFGPIVVLFWLVNNLFFLVMSLFFVDGRVPYRKYERVLVQMPCRVRYKGEDHWAVTRDISEKGISLTLDKPYFFDEKDKITLFLDTEDYHVNLTAEVVHVSGQEDKWNYSLIFTDLNGCYDDLLGILYDRIPTVPLEIKRDSGSFEDLKLNTKKRVVPPFYQKRAYPRVVVDEELGCIAEGMEKVKVYDFNYVYVTMECDKEIERMQLKAADTVVFDCQYREDVRNKLRLYEIENYRDVMNNPVQRHEILEWLVACCRKEEKNGKETIQPKKKESTEFNEMEILDGKYAK